MKKALTIFGILLMVYSLSTCKVYSSEIRVDTTTTTSTTTTSSTFCHFHTFFMNLIDPSPSLPGTTISIPLEIYWDVREDGTWGFNAEIGYDDTVFENPGVESNPDYNNIGFTIPAPGILRVSGGGECYRGNVANILFDIKETAIPGTYSLSMSCSEPRSCLYRCVIAYKGCSGADVTVLQPTCECPEISVTGCISGTVVYAPNQQPSPGMTVTLRRLSPEPGVKMEATADSDGCYRFSPLLSGKYIIGLKGCKSRSDRKERTIVIVDFVTINKNIGWRHNRRLTRCFYSIRD